VNPDKSPSDNEGAVIAPHEVKNMIILKTLDVQGFDPAIHGMRNPKNSWAKSDSYYPFYCSEEEGKLCRKDCHYDRSEERRVGKEC
jgi:hypothetical protein